MIHNNELEGSLKSISGTSLLPRIFLILMSFTSMRKANTSRKSAPLVKVNSTYMKHKVQMRQPCCTGQSCPQSQVQYKLGTGKVDPARKFKCTRLPMTSSHIVKLKTFLFFSRAFQYQELRLKKTYKISILLTFQFVVSQVHGFKYTKQYLNITI